MSLSLEQICGCWQSGNMSGSSCQQGRERTSCKAGVCCREGSTASAIKQRLLTCRAHRPVTGSAGKASSPGVISALFLTELRCCCVQSTAGEALFSRTG